MDSIKSVQDSELLKTFTKCGHIYKSPAINDKIYFFFCLECTDFFASFEAFLSHSHSETTLLSEAIEEDPDLKTPVLKLKAEEITKEPNEDQDPLEEDGYSFLELQPDTIKNESSTETIENVEMEIQTEILPKDYSDSGDTDDEAADADYEPGKQSDEDEQYAVDDDLEEDDHDGNCDEDICDNVGSFPEGEEKINLKRFTKNHAFIRTIIEAYKQQTLLWDITRSPRNPQKKLEAYNAMKRVVYEKYRINVTTKQIEQMIKRLRLRFLHQYRKNNFCSLRSDDTTKILWFYDQLKFIEPHMNAIKQKTNICQELTDEQFLEIVKLVKENECIWNEDNIYHTSVGYKQESLQNMANKFNSSFNSECFTVNEIKNIIEELKEMAIEENKHKLKDGHQPLNRFYKELNFLMAHVGPFNCTHCPKSFSDVYGYKLHVSKHEGTKPFKCMLCHKELTHKKEFMCHLRRHTKECPFQCEFCGKSFPSKKEWQRHVIKHGSKPYVCELCADSFYTQHQLTNHMKNHANIRDHVCPQCGKGFTHRGLLRQHLQTHNKTECLCPVCNNVYANPRSLRKHYVRVHELQQDASSHIYSCKICMITFTTVQEAKQHRKEHKQSLPAKRKHVCDICGHDFAYPRNLADHKKIHTNIRDQVCDVCGKAFTNANLLNQHKNVHNGQKFVCKACGKDYAHYRGLCRHITKVHRTNIKELCTVIEKQDQDVS